MNMVEDVFLFVLYLMCIILSIFLNIIINFYELCMNYYYELFIKPSIVCLLIIKIFQEQRWPKILGWLHALFT